MNIPNRIQLLVPHCSNSNFMELRDRRVNCGLWPHPAAQLLPSTGRIGPDSPAVPLKMKKILAALILIGTPIAYASTYRGVIHEIRIAALATGDTRVSVLTSGTTDCSAGSTTNGWYSFEYSSRASTGAAWLAMLLSARALQASIVIHGAATCDGSGMEKISEIDLP